MLVVQGRDDEYGTLRQVETLAASSGAPVRTLLLDRCGHAPHRDQPERVLEALAEFVAAL